MIGSATFFAQPRDRPWSEAGALPRFVAGSVGGAAALAVALLLLTANRYGYHRDELYFVAASRHLAWGYVDQPPLSVALVWLSRALFGGSLIGLHLLPALADGAVVMVTGLIARELGGRRFAQSLAALSVALGPFLIAGHLAGPTIYDLLGWAVCSLLVARILRTGRDYLWVAVGAVIGLAVLNKETILLLALGLSVGLLVDRRAKLLESPWLWTGAALALLIWAPNLVWQAQHGWPRVEMSQSLQREHSGLAYSIEFIFLQVLLPGWWVAPLWLAGLWALLREQRFRGYRCFAFAYLFLFVLIGVVIGDRPYYIAGLYPFLITVGAVVSEDVVAGTRRFFSTRAPRIRVLWGSGRVVLTFVVVAALVDLPLSLPVLPARTLAVVPLQNINYNLGETIGWQRLVATVGRVYRSIPPSTRSSVAIVTGNYGEAGAIDRYGPSLGLPSAHSGHNSYWWWGPPGPTTGTTIAVGFESSTYLELFFRRVTLAARIHNRLGVENDEEGQPVWICRDPRAPWPAMWPEIRHYD